MNDNAWGVRLTESTSVRLAHNKKRIREKLAPLNDDRESRMKQAHHNRDMEEMKWDQWLREKMMNGLIAEELSEIIEREISSAGLPKKHNMRLHEDL